MNLPIPHSHPMRSDEIMQTAEAFARKASAWSTLAAAVTAFEDATGTAIALIHADDDGAVTVTPIPAEKFYAARKREPKCDAEMRAAPQELGQEARTDTFGDHTTKTPEQPVSGQHSASQGHAKIAHDDAKAHVLALGQSGKWGFAADLEMINRAIDGQTETDIAAVMEFSTSFIRQRFNLLVDRTHGQGNRFTREQVRDALLAIARDAAA